MAASMKACGIKGCARAMAASFNRPATCTKVNGKRIKQTAMVFSRILKDTATTAPGSMTVSMALGTSDGSQMIQSIKDISRIARRMGPDSMSGLTAATMRVISSMAYSMAMALTTSPIFIRPTLVSSKMQIWREWALRSGRMAASTRATS